MVRLATTKQEKTDNPTPKQAKIGFSHSFGLPTKTILAYLTCALIWGTTWYTIRICIEPGGYPSFTAAALRFSLAAFFLAAIWLVRKKQTTKPTNKVMLWIASAGLLSGIAYGLLYTAEEKIAGGLAAVLSATGPLIAAIIAAGTGTETLRKSTVIGSILAIGGVALVFHDRLQVSQAQAAAVGLLTINCLLNSSSNVVMKRHGHNISALASNTIFLSSSSLMLWVIAAACGKCTIPYPLPPGPTAALLYLTIFGTLIAFGCFFYLLKTVRLSTAMTLAFVTPLIALMLDALFEKHCRLTMESYAGIGVVLFGVATSLFSRQPVSNSAKSDDTIKGD